MYLYSNTRARICKRLRSPGIDSEESIQSAYVAWRAGTTNRVVVPVHQAENRLLGSLKGLQIRAQNNVLKHSFLYHVMHIQEGVRQLKGRTEHGVVNVNIN
jgi:hypothetical protein